MLVDSKCPLILVKVGTVFLDISHDSVHIRNICIEVVSCGIFLYDVLIRTCKSDGRRSTRYSLERLS